jgi:hypothetical protein
MYIKIDGDFKIPTCNKDFKQRNVAKIKEQIFNSNPCYGNASSATRDTHGERERERERERGMGCPILQKCKLGKQESYKCKAPTVTLVY